MTTNTWTGAVGADFTNGSNWSLGTAPGLQSSTSNEDVVIATDGAFSAIDGAVCQIASLTIGSAAELDIEDAGRVIVQSSISNGSTISLINSELEAYTNISISGSGTLYLYGSEITDAGFAGVTVDNQSTIWGYGSIDSSIGGTPNNLSLTNEAGGTIQATYGDALTIDTGHTIENQGLLSAALNSMLVLEDNVDQTAPFGFGNTAGTIRAFAKDAEVLLSDVSVTGGTLSTSGGGKILAGNGGSASTYASFIGVNVAGEVDVGAGDELILSKSIGDKGAIDLIGGGEVEVDGDVNLSGSGIINLSADGSKGGEIVGATGGDELDTYATIKGFGGIGDGTMVLSNSGIIDADVKNQTLTLALNSTNQTESANGGTIEAFGGGLVDIGTGDPNGSDFQNNGIIAAYAGSSVTVDDQIDVTNFDNSGALNGGTWTASGKDATLTLSQTFPFLNATMILNRAGSVIDEATGNGGIVTLESELEEIDKGGELEILGGRNYTVSESIGFYIDGRLQLGGGVFNGGKHSIGFGRGGIVAGYGTVAGKFDAEEGTFYASGGTLKIESAFFSDDTLSGTGTIELTGAIEFDDPNSLKVANFMLDAADVVVTDALSDAKTFVETGGSTIDFSGGSLTLSGKTTLTGGKVIGAGMLSLDGATTLSGFGISGGANVSIGATTTLTGAVMLGALIKGTKTIGAVKVASGGVLSLSSSGSIVITAGTSDRLAIYGTVLKNSTGTSTIGVATGNVGTILAEKGTLDFKAGVGNTGKAMVEGGAILEFDAAVGAQAVTFSTGGGTLKLEDAPAFAGSVAKLGVGDKIDVGHFGKGTSFTYAANAKNTGGTLTLTDGKASAKLSLVGSYSKTGFKLTTGTSGDTLVTYATPKASERPEVAMATPSSSTDTTSTNTWTGAAKNNDFENGKNWSLGISPVDSFNNNEDVVITAKGAAPQFSEDSVDLTGLTLGATDTLSVLDDGYLYVGGTISIANGGVLALQGGSDGGSKLAVSDDTLSGGAIKLSGGSSIIGDNSGKTVSIVNSSTIEGSGTIGDGTVMMVNKGLIDADLKGQTLTMSLNNNNSVQSDSISADALVDLDGQSINEKTIEATNGGTVIFRSGTSDAVHFFNEGSIAAYVGSGVYLDLIDLDNFSTDGSFSELSGGTWAATGKAATLTFANRVDVLAATVILDGAGSVIQSDGGGGSITLEAMLQEVLMGGELEVLGGRNYTVNVDTSFFIDGRLQLGGGTISNKFGLLTDSDTNAVIAGYGKVAGGLDVQDGSTVFASGGTLEIDSCDFHASTLSGTGTLELTGAIEFENEKITISVATLTVNDADLVADGALSDAKTFVETGGSTIDFEGGSLTLSGKTTLTGGKVMGAGTFSLDGSTTSSGFGISGGATVSIGATTTLTGAVTLGAITKGTKTTGTLKVASGGVLSLSSGGSIGITAGTSDKLAVSGTVLKNSIGTSTIGATTNNVGTILVDKGMLEFKAIVYGAGKAIVEGGAILEFDATVGQQQAVSFSTGGGRLKLEDAPAFDGTVAKLGAGDTIDIGHFGKGTTSSYLANAKATGGTLTLTDGKASAKLTLVGSYSKTGFKLTTGTSGDTLVTYAAPKASALPEVAMAAPATSSHDALFMQALFEAAFDHGLGTPSDQTHAVASLSHLTALASTSVDLDGAWHGSAR